VDGAEGELVLAGHRLQQLACDFHDDTVIVPFDKKFLGSGIRDAHVSLRPCF
jgi:hypothetical protein